MPCLRVRELQEEVDDYEVKVQDEDKGDDDKEDENKEDEDDEFEEDDANDWSAKELVCCRACPRGRCELYYYFDCSYIYSFIAVRLTGFDAQYFWTSQSNNECF